MSQEKFIIFASLNNPVVFKQLNVLVDTLPGQIMGIWQLSTGKCLQVVRNVIKHKQVFCQVLAYSRTELLVVQREHIVIYDISKQTQREIPLGGILEQVQVHDKGKYLYGLARQKKIMLLDLESSTSHCQELNEIVQRIVLLKDYLLVLTSDSQLVFLDKQLQRRSVACVLIGVTLLVALDDNSFAAYYQNTLQVMQIQDSKTISHFSITMPEVDSLFYLKSSQQIAAAGQKKLRLVELKTKKSSQVAVGEDYNQVLDCGKQLVLAINHKTKQARLLELGRNASANTLKTFHGDITNIQKLLSIQDGLIGMLCFTKQPGGSNQQEVRVYDLQKNEIVARKALDRNNYTVDQESLGYVQGKIQLMQTQNALGTMGLLSFAYNDKNEQMIELDLAMESIKYYPALERLGGMARGGVAYGVVDEEGLLMVYDYSLRRLWQHPCSPQAVFTLLDASHLALQNTLGYIEIYDTLQNTLHQKIDFQVLSLSLLNLDSKFSILVTANAALAKQEIVIYKNQRLIYKQLLQGNVVKVQKFGKFVFVLFSNGKQAILNLALNKILNINNSFVKDFIRHAQQIIILEENFVKIISIS